jgi:hypothetical protein
MHWSVKLPDNFEMCEHSWPCRFHINNNIGKYLLTRPKIKKERNCKFLVKGHYFKIGLIPKAISIHKIPFGQMMFIDKSILCQTFINFEAFYQFLGIFLNN